MGYIANFKVIVETTKQDDYETANCPYCGHEAMIHLLPNDFEESNRICRHYTGYDGNAITFTEKA